MLLRLDAAPEVGGAIELLEDPRLEDPDRGLVGSTMGLSSGRRDCGRRSTRVAGILYATIKPSMKSASMLVLDETTLTEKSRIDLPPLASIDEVVFVP